MPTENILSFVQLLAALFVAAKSGLKVSAKVQILELDNIQSRHVMCKRSRVQLRFQ